MVKKVRLSALACERCSNLSGGLWGVSEQSKAGPLVATHRAPDSGSQGSGVWLHRLKWVQTVSTDAELHQTRQSSVFANCFIVFTPVSGVAIIQGRGFCVLTTD